MTMNPVILKFVSKEISILIFIRRFLTYLLSYLLSIIAQPFFIIVTKFRSDWVCQGSEVNMVQKVNNEERFIYTVMCRYQENFENFNSIIFIRCENNES